MRNVTAKKGGSYDEHLQWCKDCAFKELEKNNPQQAIAVFEREMKTHPETKDSLALDFIPGLKGMGELSTAAQVREFINGFM